MKGSFFAFEGIDGSGKTTQLSHLANRLREAGYQVMETQEPTKNPIGKLIRSSLRKEFPLSEASSALLFAADRMDHLQRSDGLLAQLDDDLIILCDRYLLSSLAYNSLHQPLDWILDINREAFQLLRPTAHLLFDVPAEVAMRRIESRAHQKERYETLHQLHRVRTLYRSLAETLTAENIVLIDAEPDPTVVAESVWLTISPFLSRHTQGV